MLVGFQRVIFCFILLLPCVCERVEARDSGRPQVYLLGSRDTTDICLRQSQSMEECVDVHELVRLIVQLRDFMISQGCEFPRLTSILQACREALIKDGIEIDDAEFEALQAEFQSYEEDDGVLYKQVRHHHKKKKKEKEVKINSKTAMGFVKFLGGTLLCFVPVPLVQTAGVSLAALGVSEMVDGVREDSDKKDFEQRLDANRRVDSSLKGTP